MTLSFNNILKLIITAVGKCVDYKRKNLASGCVAGNEA